MAPIIHEMLDDIYVPAGRDWVNPAATREKLITPHEFDAFYIWRIGEIARAETIDTRTLREENWAAYRAEELNMFLRTHSNRNLHAVALAEYCDFDTGNPYWLIFVKETR